MAFDKPIIHTSDPYKSITVKTLPTRTIYYGEVISIDDDTDGGRIKVRIRDLDNQTSNTDLPWCYPNLPKFFHVYPQVGEVVRIYIEDIKYPQRSRFWEGSIISQLHKIGFDSSYTALSTTNVALTNPDKAPSTFPDANGVFPLKSDIAIIGKVNTDVILRINEVHIRAGKHENDNILKLNTKNPAEISLVYEPKKDSDIYYSSTMVMSDKIALITHSGKPQFKAARIDANDRLKIFENAHPIARADVLVEALNIIRNVIIGHIHGYSGLPADKDTLIRDLEKIDFNAIIQPNVVTN